MTPAVATESMMQLANVYRGRWDEREQVGLPHPRIVAAVLRHRPRDRPDHRRLQDRGRGQERPRRRGERFRRRQGEGRCGGLRSVAGLRGRRRRGDQGGALARSCRGRRCRPRHSLDCHSRAERSEDPGTSSSMASSGSSALLSGRAPRVRPRMTILGWQQRSVGHAAARLRPCRLKRRASRSPTRTGSSRAAAG